MWTAPNRDTAGTSNLQSIVYAEDYDVLLAGIAGTDGVLFGCDATGGADMTPSVAKGAVLSNGILRAVTAGTVTIGAANAAHEWVREYALVELL